jgi:hypothetical protein
VRIDSQRQPERLRGAEYPERALKRKIRVCAAEAAVISIGIHLLLLSFGGSMVLWRIGRQQAAAFKSENIERPEPERRAAQLPVKIQEMQKKVTQPKVTARMAAAAETPFTLPAMNLPEMKFEAAGSSMDSLSLSSQSMPGGLDLGVTGVNFFGTRSSGEKMVFVLDASRQMMEDSKGGYFTYKFAKDKIHQLVDAMPAATLFNVMVYNDSNVDMFRPLPVPATQANRDALKAWLEPVNSNPNSAGQVAEKYRSPFTYRSDIGGGARHWLKAVQAAMEQTADNIFVLCAGFGRYSASSPGQSGSAAERDEKRMADYRAKTAAQNEKAVQLFNEENAARAAKGLPPKIIYDWNNYMTQELRIVMPDPPPVIGSGSSSAPSNQQPERLVLDHLDALWAYHYTPKELMPPRIHFVYLVAADTRLYEGYTDVMALKKTADAFQGDFEFLRGAKTMKNLIRYNPGF